MHKKVLIAQMINRDTETEGTYFNKFFDVVLAIRKNYKPLFLHILSETQWWMSCRVTGGKAFEQMLAPNLRRGVKSDQCEEKG